MHELPPNINAVNDKLRRKPWFVDGKLPIHSRFISPFLLLLLLGTLLQAGENPAPPGKPSRGYHYTNDRDRDVPWSIHVLKIDRDHPELELYTALGRGTMLGMATVSDQIKLLPPDLGRPIGAINGDFYHSSRIHPGDPEGLQISQGELISAPTPERTCFWINAEGKPQKAVVQPEFKVTWPNGASAPIGLNQDCASDTAVLYTSAAGTSTRTSEAVDLVLERHNDELFLPLQVGRTFTVRVKQALPNGNTPLNRQVMVLSLGRKLAARMPPVSPGTLLKLSTATQPDLAGARTGIGGGPALVTGGKRNKLSDSQGRHPRTAVGWSKTHIFLVEVDGRQRLLSVGMSFLELAEYMLKLGCEEALNLDGGGSATFWMMGNVLNNPSEGRERPAANALVLLQKPKPQVSQAPVAVNAGPGPANSAKPAVIPQ